MVTVGSGPATVAAGEVPWLALPPLPPLLDLGQCAYRDALGTFTGTRTWLASTVRSDSAGTICWVWDPASPGWVRVEDVPWLSAELRERATSALKSKRSDAARIAGWLAIPSVLEVMSDGISGAGLFAWLLLMAGLLPFLEHSWDLYRMRSDETAVVARSARESRYLAWLQAQTSRGTWALLASIGLVAMVQIAAARTGGESAAILAAGVVKSAIREGEWWRALTGALLHGGLLHFALNALSLYGLGRVVEATFGWAYVPLVFVLAALAGSVCSLVLLPDTVSVGASGGILGLLGFVLTATSGRRTRPLPELLYRDLLRSALYCAVGGILAYRIIDNAGHLGGFVAGAGLGFALSRLELVRVGGAVATSVRLAGAAASGLILAGVTGAILAMIEAAGR